MSISFQATEKEAKLIKRLAKSNGMSVSNLLRTALLQQHSEYFTEKTLKKPKIALA